jgi:alkyldihydroxyacetonephosphate synthase
VPVAHRGEQDLIAFPSSSAEVAELVGTAANDGVAVIPVGTSQRAPGANSPADKARLFLDFKRMRHVLRLDETSLVVHVQAGLTAVELEEILSRRGLSVGDYPPSSLSSTIGGLLAVRTPGKSSRRHGFIEDAVLGISAVLANGRTIHTKVAPRRASGPDLARAICGSEGTLGLITSAVLRIHRRPESRFFSAYRLPGLAEALSAINLALREEAAPAAMRAYDGNEAAVRLGANICEHDEGVLVAATAGPTDLAMCDRDLIASAVEAFGGSTLPEEVAQTWWRLRVGQDKSRAPLPRLQVSATPSKQNHVYLKALEAARDAGYRARAYASRFDIDGGIIFFTLTNSDGEVATGTRADTALELVAQAAADAGGYLLGARNEALLPYFEELRKRLDPLGIMNPGAVATVALSDVRPEPQSGPQRG